MDLRRRKTVGGLELPRPLRAGAVVASTAVVPFVLDLAGLVRPLPGFAAGGALLAFGCSCAVVAHHQLVGLRRRADREIRVGPKLHTALVSWRSAELTSPKHRLRLARSVEQTARDLSPSRLPGPTPLNRVAARPYAGLLVQIAERLRALDDPVTPFGVLVVEELLTSPDSPLYAPDGAAQIRSSFSASLAALDSGPIGIRTRLDRSLAAS